MHEVSEENAKLAEEHAIASEQQAKSTQELGKTMQRMGEQQSKHGKLITQVASYRNACSRVKAKIKVESLRRSPFIVTA